MNRQVATHIQNPETKACKGHLLGHLFMTCSEQQKTHHIFGVPPENMEILAASHGYVAKFQDVL